jgi:hypothetical protein
MARETRFSQDTSEGRSRSKTRPLLNLLALIAAILLAQAAYLYFSGLLPSPGTAPASVELRGTDKFYSPERKQCFDLVYQPSVKFTASGAPDESLQLENYQIEQGRANETWSRSITLDGDGTLASTATDLHEGLNLLTVGEEYQGSYVWVLSRSNPHDLTGITRTLVISLTPAQLSATYRATFAPGATDADLQDLLAGRIEPALFLRRIFYSTSNDFTNERFDDISKPQVTITRGISCVEIRATTDNAQLEPEQLATLLNVSLPQRSPPQSLAVTVTAGEGVAVHGYSPLPTIAEGRAYSWIDNDPSDPIELEYDADGELDPTSAPVRSVHAMFQSVLETLWQKVGRITTRLLLNIAMPALLIFPLAWLWRHAKRHPVPAGEADLLPPLESGIGFIVTLFVGFPIGIWVLRSSGAVWAAILGCVVLLVLHRYPRVPLRWLWLILSSLLAAAAVGSLVRLPWKPAPLIALAGAPLLLFLYWLSRELARPGAFLSTHLSTWSGRLGLLALLLLLFVLAYPATTQITAYYSPLSGWLPTSGFMLAMLVGQVLIPLAALLAALGLLRRHGKAQVRQEDVRKAEEADSWSAALQKAKQDLGEELISKTQSLWTLDGRLLAVGQLLLAYFALGVLRRPFSTVGALIPIAPVLGWFLFRRLVHQPGEMGLSYTERIVLASERLRESIGRTVLGKTSSQENEEETTDQPDVPPILELTRPTRREIPLRDAFFGWGNPDQPWKNGKAACVRGAVLVAILLILYGPTVLNEALQQTATPFILLEIMMVSIVPFAGRWLLYAFILGYFFPYIRGRHGWQKGLYLALTISVCTLAQDVVVQARSMNDVMGLLFEAGQVIVYLSIVGIWAFDLPRIKEAGGSAADLLRTIYGLPFLTSYLSGLVPALVGIVQSAITGEFSSLVQTFVEIVLPTISQLGGAP